MTKVGWGPGDPLVSVWVKVRGCGVRVYRCSSWPEYEGLLEVLGAFVGTEDQPEGLGEEGGDGPTAE